MNFASWPIWVNLLIFAASAGVVWIAGTRMSTYAAQLGDKTGMGHAFAGLLFLGGATSLPELATVTTSAYFGDSALAINNILGSIATNVLLALADAVLGRDALTSVVAAPSTILQGVWGILLLAIVTAGIVAGEYAVFGVGLWSLAIVPGFAIAVLLSAGYDKRAPWTIVKGAKRGERNPDAAGQNGDEPSLSSLAFRAVLAALALLVAGFLLSRTGEAVAQQTGFSTGIVGFTLVGLSTSLPEISSMVGAVRARNYELAVGDIFGTNLFDIVLIPIADAVFRSGAILNEAGRFETIAALLGIALTAVFIIGLLERRDRTIFRMGYDSLAAIGFYIGGLFVLYFVGTG